MLQTSMPGEWREGLHSKQNPSEKGPHNLAHSRRALSRKLEVTRTEMTEKEWGARCDSMKKRPCSHNAPSAVTVGASFPLQVSATARRWGRGRQTHGRIGNLLEGMVRSNSKDNFAIRGDGYTVVAAGLEHTFRLSLSRGQIPFIYSTVCATRNQFAIICIPRNGTNLQGIKICPVKDTHTHTCTTLTWKRRMNSSRVPLD